MGSEQGLWTFGEREVCRSPYTWLGQVDVELPGGERFWHDVIRLHRAAAMVLVDDADRVLMLWRHRFVMDRWGWELPGGLVDEDEEPAEAAQRELEEETGYRAGRVEPLIAFQPRAGAVDGELFAFVGRDPERIGEPTEVNEAARLEWVPLASGAADDRGRRYLECRVAGAAAAISDGLLVGAPVNSSGVVG
jgi:8-oxo-dGTP pyrophosphatase MutT (NUDIX family)